jgi:tetratricopeptide (TPR) repeat protein
MRDFKGWSMDVPRAALLATLTLSGLSGCGNKEPIQEPPEAEVRRLNERGVELLMEGRLQIAEGLFLNALALGQSLDDLGGRADALYNLGILHRDQGRMDDALTELRMSEEVFREIQRGDGLARSLAAEGSVHLAAGRMDAAREAYDRASREVPDDSSDVRSEVLLGISALHLAEGKPEAAVEAATAAADAARKDALRADALFHLARAQARLGQGKEAREALLQVLVLDKSSGRRPQIAETLVFLGELELEKGNRKEAGGYFLRAAGVYEALGLGEREDAALKAAAAASAEK